MGTENSFECCRAHPQEGQYSLRMLEKASGEERELSQEHYKVLSSYLRKVNLLTALDYSIRQVSLHPQQLIDINSSFNLISKFIEVVEVASNQNFLSVLQAQTYRVGILQQQGMQSELESKSTELCLLDLSSFQRPNQKDTMSNDIMQCFKLLTVLKLEQPLNDFEPQQFFEKMVEQLVTIPVCPFRGSNHHDTFWDIAEGEGLSEMTFHLRYNLDKYLPFVNNYLSVNDPTSYTHIRFFFHMIEQHFCNSPLAFRTQRYACRLQSSEAESWLYRKGTALVTTNFVGFQPDLFLSQCQELSVCSRETQDKRKTAIVRLIISPRVAKSPKKFINNGILHYLPFTMFAVQKVLRKSETVVQVYLAEMEDQVLIAQIKKNVICDPKQLEENTNHVLINKTNLVNQLNSLREGVLEELEQGLRIACQNASKEEKASARVESFLTHFYDEYKIRVASLEIKKKEDANEEMDIPVVQKSAVEDQEEFFWEGPEEPSQLIEISRQQADRLENKLRKYIESSRLEKLEISLLMVDKFFYLKILNLSQSWLKNIECMNCFPNLRELYLYSNEILKIEGLESNLRLKTLSLARNKIRTLEHLQPLFQLDSLYITKNPLSKDSAEYLTKLKLKKMKNLSVSFAEDPNACFETLAHRLPFRIRQLVINNAEAISSRTKNMLQKRLKGTSILLFDT